MKRIVAGLSVLLAFCVMAGCAMQQEPAPAKPDESLVNTYWKLTYLDSAPVTVVANQREPHFVLHADPARVMGATGCNRMMGNYHVNGDELRFEALASTRMACQQGARTEQRFLEVLNAVAAWRVEGEHLTLLDAQDQELARFKAVHLQ
ncbi:META domain-containing protein [Chromohalobacter sp. 48-RD10]|uniref:META domain-containing protein n=1 Tax=Chromohalobacter sp. 48-RD10 TaxID=2994063 RepID=UPI0024693DCB|nr:META domain-containing protein [Chromohalobacter sp. 48-RD10]